MEAKDEILIRELDLRSRDAIIASTAAVFWAEDASVQNNGSMFFIDGGEQLFGVTAGHVYKDYMKRLDSGKVLSPWTVNTLPFEPLNRLLSLGTGGVDIATFKLTDDELKRIDRFPSPWPPVRPEEGEFILFCGLPGAGRSQDQNGVNFTYFVGKLAIENVGESTLSFQRPPNDKLTDITGKGLPSENLRMGGMSGGPMFVLRDQPPGKQWALAGLVTEGHPTWPIVIGARAELIGNDGTIREAF